MQINVVALKYKNFSENNFSLHFFSLQFTDSGMYLIICFVSQHVNVSS